MTKKELIFWAFFFILVLIRPALHIDAIFVLFVGFLLSNFYFLFSFFILNEIKLRHMFKARSYQHVSSGRIVKSAIIGLVYSLACMAILFHVLTWPGSMVMLFMALVGLFVLFFITRIKNKRSPNQFYKNINLRNVFFIVICLVLGLTFLLPEPIQNRIFPLKGKENMTAMTN